MIKILIFIKTIKGKLILQSTLFIVGLLTILAVTISSFTNLEAGFNTILEKISTKNKNVTSLKNITTQITK
jgi:hypothetical protein